MMDAFLNMIKAQASALDQGTGQPRLGIVSSVDPSGYTARVMLQPEGVLSGWLPVLSSWIGAGWGLACPPSPGDQVLVLAQEGDAEHGIIAGRLWSATQPPPAAPSGELWLVHKSGSFLKLTNDGLVSGNAKTWVLTGDVHVTGSVVVSGDVVAGGISLDSHRHGGVKAGSDDTQGPV